MPTSFTVGIAPANGEVIAEFPFDLLQGGSYVVVATGLLGDNATPFNLAATGTTFGASSSNVVGLEVYHGSTDAPAVDVYANDALLLSSFSYGDFSGFVEVPAVDYTLGVAPAGGDIIAVGRNQKELDSLGKIVKKLRVKYLPFNCDVNNFNLMRDISYFSAQDISIPFNSQ